MKYGLKHEFDLPAFLRSVGECKGEVFFEDRTGNRLNLKSQLSKYLFLTVRPDDPLLKDSCIECSSEDGQILAKFLVTAPGGNVMDKCK